MDFGTKKPLYRASKDANKLPPGQISDKPTVGHLMYDPRVRRGPSLSHTADAIAAQPAALTTNGLGATAASSLKSSSKSSDISSSKRTLRVTETASSMATKLGLPPSLVALDATANLDITARKRGPNPFDIRAGSKPREEIDLTGNLEEQAPPRRTVENGTQGDALHHPLPPPAPYTAAAPKRGVDADTQVTAGSREWAPRGTTGAGTEVLFNFDTEIAPVVASLTDDILAQAEEEVAHEEELIALAGRRDTVQAALDRDAALVKSLEASAKAAATRKQTKLSQAQAEHTAAVNVMEKVAATQMAKEVLSGSTLPSAHASLHASGFYYDPTKRAVEEQIMPEVMAGVHAALTSRQGAGEVVDEVLGNAFALSEAAYQKRLADEAAAAAELRREYFIRVYVRIPRRPDDITANGILPHGTFVPVEEASGEGAGGGAAGPVEVFDATDGTMRTVVFGPVSVTKLDSIAVLEDRIHTWVLMHTNAHTRRVMAMAGGKDAPMALYLDGKRLPEESILLSRPLDSLGGLEFRPAAAGGWILDIPEEPVVVQGEAGTAAAAGGEAEGAATGTTE